MKQDTMQQETERLAKVIIEASKMAPQSIAPYIVKAAPMVAWVGTILNKSMPVVLSALQKGSDIVARLPKDVLMAILGLFICFFGGVYPALIAAMEVRSRVFILSSLHAPLSNAQIGFYLPHANRRSRWGAGRTPRQIS